MKSFFKKMKCIWILSFCMVCVISNVAFADTQGKIDDTKDAIKDLQQQQQQVQDQVDSLNQQKGSLQDKLSNLNVKLTKIGNSIVKLDKQITQTNQEITQTQNDLDVATAKSQTQYEDMKKRIRFMYENGSDSMVQIIFSSKSVADMLNKTEYVKELSEYDRAMLKQYQATQAEIAQKKEDLQGKQKELEKLNETMKKSKQQVASLISQTQTNIKQAESQISNAQNVSEDIQNQINQQKAAEAQLEIQKAKEDAARLAEIKREEEEAAAAKAAAQAAAQQSGQAVPQISYDTSDVSLLAALIYCEAGGEGYDGQLAVGSVVINRVNSTHFPNSVSSVIYQGGQFSPVASGRFATVLGQGMTTSSCMKAAQSVLSGNVTNNFLYFRVNNGIISGTVIGNQVFY